MDENNILKIINQLDINVIFLFIKICIVYFIVSIIKSYLENLVNYLIFRSNPYVSIGKTVEVNGFIGNITHISPSVIVISGKDKDLVIRTFKWNQYTWIFYKYSLNDYKE